MQDKPNDQHLDNPSNIASKKLSDQIIPPTAIDTITPNLESENMEVHHHPDLHHKPKKWKEYFLEFFMIFIAVTLGFFAESYREHIVESHREEAFMKAMIDDLKHDTAEFRRMSREIKRYYIPVFRKSTQLLFSKDYSDSATRAMYDTVTKAIRFFTVSFQENTVTELRNSGSMRLIRNKAIIDSLNKYWNSCYYLKDPLLLGYENTRLIAKELLYSLFNLNNMTSMSSESTTRNGVVLKFLSKDNEQFIKLGNYLFNLDSQLSGPIFNSLNGLDQNATTLIALIQNKYQLE